jgi:hypothetical protein
VANLGPILINRIIGCAFELRPAFPISSAGLSQQTQARWCCIDLANAPGSPVTKLGSNFVNAITL